MLKIKLTRIGKRHQPTFRIVVVEAREKNNGKYLESLGYYIPTTSPSTVQLDMPTYLSWLKKGAQPTVTVADIVKKQQRKA